MSAAVLWSGGKDCFAAGLRSGALAAPGTRLVTFAPAGEAIAFRCHPLGVMRRQAAGLELAHEPVEIAREGWEASYRCALAADGVERVVTGDITPEQWPWLAAACDAAGLDDPAACHPCGERGECHTVVTAFAGTRFVDADPATFAHSERDGIWALDWAGGDGTHMSDFH